MEAIEHARQEGISVEDQQQAAWWYVDSAAGREWGHGGKELAPADIHTCQAKACFCRAGSQQLQYNLVVGLFQGGTPPIGLQHTTMCGNSRR